MELSCKRSSICSDFFGNRLHEENMKAIDDELFLVLEKSFRRLDSLQELTSIMYLITAKCKQSEYNQNLVRTSKCLKILRLLVEYTMGLSHNFVRGVSVCFDAVLSFPTNKENQNYCRRLLPVIIDRLCLEKRLHVIWRIFLIGAALLRKNDELILQFKKNSGLNALYDCTVRMLKSFSNSNADIQENQEIVSLLENCLVFWTVLLNEETATSSPLFMENLSSIVLNLFEMKWIFNCDTLLFYLLDICSYMRSYKTDFFADYKLNDRFCTVLSSSIENTANDNLRILAISLLKLTKLSVSIDDYGTEENEEFETEGKQDIGENNKDEQEQWEIPIPNFYDDKTSTTLIPADEIIPNENCSIDEDDDGNCSVKNFLEILNARKMSSKQIVHDWLTKRTTATAEENFHVDSAEVENPPPAKRKRNFTVAPSQLQSPCSFYSCRSSHFNNGFRSLTDHVTNNEEKVDAYQELEATVSGDGCSECQRLRVTARAVGNS